MKDKNITVYQLIHDCPLSRNTIRDIVNDPYKSFSLSTAETLATALDCNISTLLIDDWKILYFEEMNKTLFDSDRNQIFSPDNLKVMDRLFSEIGIHCTFEPYNDFRSVNIREENQFSPHHIDINMRIEKLDNYARLTVVDFFFCANKKMFSEEQLKNELIYLIEVYARRSGFQEIMFHIWNDYTVRADAIYEHNFHIETDYSYTQGTKKQLFIEQDYHFIPNKITEAQFSFQKKLMKPRDINSENILN